MKKKNMMNKINRKRVVIRNNILNKKNKIKEKEIHLRLNKKEIH